MPPSLWGVKLPATLGYLRRATCKPFENELNQPPQYKHLLDDFRPWPSKELQSGQRQGASPERNARRRDAFWCLAKMCWLDKFLPWQVSSGRIFVHFSSPPSLSTGSSPFWPFMWPSFHRFLGRVKIIVASRAMDSWIRCRFDEFVPKDWS